MREGASPKRRCEARGGKGGGQTATGDVGEGEGRTCRQIVVRKLSLMKFHATWARSRVPLMLLTYASRGLAGVGRARRVSCGPSHGAAFHVPPTPVFPSTRRGWSAPVRVLDGQIEAESLQQDALAHQDLLLQLEEVLNAVGAARSPA